MSSSLLDLHFPPTNTQGGAGHSFLVAAQRQGFNTSVQGFCSSFSCWSPSPLSLPCKHSRQAKPPQHQAPAGLVCESSLQNWQPLQIRAAELMSWGALKLDSKTAAKPTPQEVQGSLLKEVSPLTASAGNACSKSPPSPPRGCRTKVIRAWLPPSFNTASLHPSRTSGSIPKVKVTMDAG